LNFIFVELPKFKKTIEKLETNADRWLYCFKHLGQMEERPEELSGGVFDRLFEKAEINKLTDTEMAEYRKSILEYADVRDCMDCARAEGMEEGKISNSFEVAKKCFQEGLPAELIVKLTGLTSEQILQIQPQNG
jgi:predicted transposase/invertase (TIGR01784 family)